MGLDIVAGIKGLSERVRAINTLLMPVLQSRQTKAKPQSGGKITNPLESYRLLKTESEALLTHQFTKDFESSPLILEALQGNTEEIEKLPDESINLVLEFVSLLTTIYARKSTSQEEPLNLQKAYHSKSTQYSLVGYLISHQIEERKRLKETVKLQEVR